MERMYHDATIVEALTELNAKGFTHDFNLHTEDIKENPYRYTIEHIYRYEGDTNPDEEAVVYGLKSDIGKKGVFVASYGSDLDTDLAIAFNSMRLKP